MSNSRYYMNSFLWSTIAKVLNAVVGFISVPLLLGYFGKSDYGLLSLATAANAYLQLFDLGMNIGSIKYFAQWREQGKNQLIERVSRTNISFYGIIGLLNALFLIGIAFWGEGLFNISHQQFLVLRISLFILALFSVFNWVSSVFSQLLISANRIAFTQQVQSVQTLLKVALIVLTLQANLSLNTYFFLSTLLLAVLFLPYYLECKRQQLISSFMPQWHWSEFRTVFVYSLSLFALSFFQMTASSSRPIILGIFVEDAARVATDYRIIEVFPMFILSIGGMFTSIFLPKASSLITKDKIQQTEAFAYRGTLFTTIVTTLLTLPVILCSNELIQVYVGPSYLFLSPWLQLWCFTLLISLHTTPCNSLILATGKTKPILIATFLACILSIGLNILLSRQMEVGSAVTSYLVYVVIVVAFNYVYNYPKLLKLRFVPLLLSFVKPVLPGIAAYLLVHYLGSILLEPTNLKSVLILHGLVKGAVWILLYISLLFGFRILSMTDVRTHLTTKSIPK